MAVLSLLVIRPSGSGKTSAVREMCYRHPEGTIYFKIGEPKNFINGLSRSVGMKTSPRTVLDLVLGYISSSYRLPLFAGRPDSGIGRGTRSCGQCC